MEFSTSLPLAVRGVWLVTIFTMILALFPVPFQSFLRTCFLRGKLLQPTTSPPKFTISQSCFLHFYIVGIVLNTSLLFLAIFHAYTLAGASSINLSLPGRLVSSIAKETQQAWRIVFLLLLLELQLVRRLYESIYVSKFSSLARMHILAYFLGIIYYILAPLSLCGPTVGELLMDGFRGLIQRTSMRGVHSSESDIQWWQYIKYVLTIGWLPWIGGALFIWGWVHQYRCHMILASLRSKKEFNKDDEHAYKIPYGDWFEYVSSAHYLAEIVMYSSFVVATAGQNLDVWLLFIFVVLNLSIAAVDTHRWYVSKFEDYPSSRRAICPFIY